MKFLIIAAVVVLNSSIHAHARPCKIAVEYVSEGSREDYYSGYPVANTLYRNAIEEVGHVKVTSSENPDYIFKPYAIYMQISPRNDNFPGKVRFDRAYFELSKSNGERIVREQFGSCQRTKRHIANGTTCRLPYSKNHSAKASKKLAKMLEEISCEY